VGDQEQGASTRRKFLAGAGLAAGAAALSATAAPGIASATPPSTPADYSFSLKWLDLANPPSSEYPVNLGTGGFAKGQFSAMGDMAALSIRILVGTGGSVDTGQGPWFIDGTDTPPGFTPVAGPNDITPVATSAWMGTGVVIGLGRPNQNQYSLSCSWQNWSNASLGTKLLWALGDRYNDGQGNVLLNYGGVVPFGNNLGPGDIVYGTLVYLRDTSEDE
jgi:hypothetical protein